MMSVPKARPLSKAPSRRAFSSRALAKTVAFGTWHFVVATGLRIGAALAVQRVDVGLDDGTVENLGHSYVCPQTGSLSSRPQSRRLDDILELPSWAVIMLRRRQTEDLGEDELARQVFPGPSPVVYATRPTPSTRPPADPSEIRTYVHVWGSFDRACHHA
jgi:hypothetical protein